EKITIGFLWLLEHCYSISKDRNYNENNTNTFFLYIILWLSYKLNQITGLKFTKINDFYTNQVNNSGKYSEFISDSSKFTDLNGFIDKQKDLLNINIEDLSKFYDASKLICSMYGKIAQNKTVDTLLNAASFVSKYKELNNYNIEDTARKINKSQNTTKSPEKTSATNSVQTSEQNSELISAQTSEVTSSSSIGNKLFTVLSVFGAIAFFLGISYKYSLFGFRRRAQKQYLREKIKNIKNRMSH
ncbi:Plasmodium variant antigen protein Cir/Yir/Bir, putative, partial [Plasmodium berghei]